MAHNDKSIDHPLSDAERANVLAAIQRTESMWGGGCVELKRVLAAHDYWKAMYDRAGGMVTKDVEVGE